MYLSSNLLSIIFLILFNIQSLSSSSCSEYYSPKTKEEQEQCECEDILINSQTYLSIKCIGYSRIPTLISNINYRTIEFESCLEDLNLKKEIFNNLNINILRIRHCNLINLTEQTFSNINEFEKFYLENSTIKFLLTRNENFQDIFLANSFEKLKSLTLKTIHYHQLNKHDKKLNFELLLEQLPKLYRLELINIYLDNYRYYHIKSIGKYLTYLSLTNTHQKTFLPIEYLISLERLLIRYLPDIFHTQSFLFSLEKLKNLKYILFEHNQLTNINYLKSNTIDDIDLSSNLIEYINEYTFEYLPKLRQLTLTENPLKFIDKNAFCGIENLQRLSIHIKHTQISPLDNCLLINYPNLQIIQDNQIKLQCNCQLMNIFYLKRKDIKKINSIFKLNQICLLKNETFQQSINIYQLDNYLNCSLNDNNNQCNHLCQNRKFLTTNLSTNIQVNPKTISLSMSLYSCFSYLLFFLLLCFLYL